jgi:hypothetical protein
MENRNVREDFIANVLEPMRIKNDMLFIKAVTPLATQMSARDSLAESILSNDKLDINQRIKLLKDNDLI